jgi:hypothetical protein
MYLPVDDTFCKQNAPNPKAPARRICSIEDIYNPNIHILILKFNTL